jgi:hypothetical protein
MDLLIVGHDIVTIDPARRTVRQGALAIRDGRIA